MIFSPRNSWLYKFVYRCYKFGQMTEATNVFGWNIYTAQLAVTRSWCIMMNSKMSIYFVLIKESRTMVVWKLLCSPTQRQNLYFLWRKNLFPWLLNIFFCFVSSIWYPSNKTSHNTIFFFLFIYSYYIMFRYPVTHAFYRVSIPITRPKLAYSFRASIQKYW